MITLPHLFHVQSCVRVCVHYACMLAPKNRSEDAPLVWYLKGFGVFYARIPQVKLYRVKYLRV